MGECFYIWRVSVELYREADIMTDSVSSSEERWGSEGIQVGGIQSKRGVLGVWFDRYVLLWSMVSKLTSPRHHRQTGPVGPTAFWKLSDSQDPRKGDVELAMDLYADGDTDDSGESMEA